MGCSHAVACPLFPLLRASLQDWRDYYCDSEDRWRGCARYKVSLTGERVPISLLPNGHHAEHLKYEAEPDRFKARNPTQSSPQAPSSRLTAWSSQTSARFEKLFPPAPAGYHQPPPSQIPQAPEPHAERARQAHNSKRGWWARLVDWMKSPA